MRRSWEKLFDRQRLFDLDDIETADRSSFVKGAYRITFQRLFAGG
ncbi:hypothetical protein SS05631_a47900 (plasmid) [Sinorhizobium sp. CCBAU 05631]|nr:hypothetical protein SS05631_a47900 [Sinorhizobium sp. CCBAU 05631]